MSDVKTDTQRLMSAISTLTSDEDKFGAHGRILADQTGKEGSVLSEIVREIGDTVLHRHLVFHFENIRTLKMEVAERRVLKIFPAVENINEAQTHIYGRDLRAEDAELLLRFLAQHTRGETCVTVVSTLPEVSGPDYADGVSFEALERRVQAHTKGQIDVPTVSSAVSKTRYLSKACIVFLREQQKLEFGPQVQVSGLKRLCNAIASEGLENGARAWRSKRESSQAVLRVKHDDVFLISLMSGENTAECLKLWSELQVVSNKS